MNGDGNQPTEIAPVITKPAIDQQELRRQRQILIAIIIAVIILVIFMIASLVFLLNPATDTARIRDIFIIFMALESIFMGLILVVLIIQLARLINLLQNEIKPILNSTNETVNTLRGTTAFLSDNLVEPVIKMNEYLAGITKGLAVIGLYRRRNK
jgi:membrane protein implicated in regulation of membrane protease activity